MAKIKESYIKCGHCGTKFPSPIFIGDTAAFDNATVAGNRAQCPKCHRVVHCNKENMSYLLDTDDGGFVGHDFSDNKT